MKFSIRVSSFAALLLVFACSPSAPQSQNTQAPAAQSSQPSSQSSTQSPVQTATPAPAESLAQSSVQVACTPASNRLCPADEGPSDASFLAFRDRLRSAVEHRSEGELTPLIATNIRTSFGSGGGIDGFRKQWRTSSNDSKLWPTLQRIIDHGGSFQSGGDAKMFWAPYVYSKWPESVDAFEHVAALGRATPIFSKPAPGAPKIATVDWEILTVSSPSKGDWTKVRTGSGTEGWVSNDDVYSPVGYRAGFSNRGGEWKLEALVAGD